jgi:hypothetical protein
VQGWLSELGLVLIDAIEAEQREMGVDGGVAEIGVHHGKLFVLLSLLRREGEGALALDLFEDQERNIDHSGKGDRVLFDRNLRRWGADRGHVVIHQTDSFDLDSAAVTALLGSRVRLFSVDGGHTADLTEHDLETAVGALSDGGVVILDDCFSELFPAVSEGAQRFLRAHADVVCVGGGGNKTFITARDHAPRYRAALARRADLLRLYHQEHASFLGEPFHSVFPPQQQRITHAWDTAEHRARWIGGWFRHHARRLTEARR